MTTTATEPPQHLQALQRANETRYGYRDLKNELRAGKTNLAQALNDPRAAGPLTIGRLLSAQWRVGPDALRRLLIRAGLSEHHRVDELDHTQRRRLVEANDHREAAARFWRAKYERKMERAAQRMYAQKPATDHERKTRAAA